MIVELKGRAFALLAYVLSFFAHNRGALVRRGTDWNRLQVQIDFSKAARLLTGFRRSNLISAETHRVSNPSPGGTLA
jgi:hypothetical protein